MGFLKKGRLWRISSPGRQRRAGGHSERGERQGQPGEERPGAGVRVRTCVVERVRNDRRCRTPERVGRRLGGWGLLKGDMPARSKGEDVLQQDWRKRRVDVTMDRFKEGVSDRYSFSNHLLSQSCNSMYTLSITEAR